MATTNDSASTSTTNIPNIDWARRKNPLGDYNYNTMTKNPDTKFTLLTLSYEDFLKAISHTVNFNNIDGETNTPDYELAKTLAPELLKYLFGITDAQILKFMTEEEKKEAFTPV